MKIIQPQSVPEAILEILSMIYLNVCDFFGIKLLEPSEVDETFFVKSLIVFLLITFFFVFSKPIYLFIRQLLRKLAEYMSDKIILKEILVIYAFIDDLTKKTLYGLFLMCCIFLIYAISYFLQLLTIVNFIYYVLGLEDLAMIFIYRI